MGRDLLRVHHALALRTLRKKVLDDLTLTLMIVPR
jgi:hypothetical protein